MREDVDVPDEMVFLLGAGASYEAGLPLSSQLTAEILTRFNSDPRNRGSKALNYVVSAIVGHQGRAGADPATLPDIETVVSAVEMLASRESLEVTPFVQTWDPAVGHMDWSFDSAKGAAGSIVNAIKKSLEGPSSGAFKVNDTIASSIRSIVDNAVGRKPGRTFAELLPLLYRSLVELLRLQDDAPLDYLTPLIRLGDAAGGVTIATLNYDLVLETAAERAATSCSTGVDSWERGAGITFPEDALRVIKLHGSINWTKVSEYNAGPNETSVSRVALGLRPPREHYDEPFIVFGRREKLRPDGPFLELRGEFLRRLRSAGVLVVVGYSFGDDHVNAAIAQWVNQDPRNMVVVIDPGFPRDIYGGTRFAEVLRSGLIQWNRPTGNWPAPARPRRLLILREPASTGLATVCAGGVEYVRDTLESQYDDDPNQA